MKLVLHQISEADYGKIWDMWVKFLKAGTSAIYFGDNLSRGIKKWLILLKKKHI